MNARYIIIVYRERERKRDCAKDWGEPVFLLTFLHASIYFLYCTLPQHLSFLIEGRWGVRWQWLWNHWSSFWSVWTSLDLQEIIVSWWQVNFQPCKYNQIHSDIRTIDFILWYFMIQIDHPFKNRAFLASWPVTLGISKLSRGTYTAQNCCIQVNWKILRTPQIWRVGF